MTNISKELFYTKIGKDVACNVLHPETRYCTWAALKLAASGAIGCTKFFFPIYVIQALLNYKNINKDYLIYLVKAQLRTLLYGCTFCVLLLGTNCLQTKLLGRFHYYAMFLSGGFWCGLAVYFESVANRNLDTLYYFNQLVEAAVLNLNHFGWIQRTPAKDTLCFMACSSVLMWLLKTQGCKPYNNLWFYTEPCKKKTGKIDSCNHEEECEKFILKSFLKYFGIGYAVEIMKFVLTRGILLIKHPKQIPTFLLTKKNVLFGLVTGLYVTIYRSLTCFLRKMEKEEKDHHHALAGFFAGYAYSIKPNLQFGITAFTTICQLLLQRFQRRVPLSPHLVGVLFSIMNAFLLHNRFLYPETCPKYIKNMVRVCTNGEDRRLFGRVVKLIL